ncbi:hypothetical protein ACIGFK_06110 [Streptomyces sp. NPDC085524]|uniref:hypothetical protein n=1 Tax=Streptomyces sp. NPDC085524 TaxID=3365728 RepID=UPI0037CCE6C1
MGLPSGALLGSAHFAHAAAIPAGPPCARTRGGDLMKRSRVLSVAALTLVLAIGSPGATSATTTAAPGGEATLAAVPSIAPPERYLVAAGTGLQMQPKVNENIYWRSLKDGREVRESRCDGNLRGWTYPLGDSVACSDFNGPGSQEALVIHDFATGAIEALPAQTNRTWVAAFSATQALATEKRADGTLALHLMGRANEPRKDTLVATPEQITGPLRVKAVDALGALVEYTTPAGRRVGLVDFTTAAMRTIPLPSGVGSADDLLSVGLGEKWIVLAPYGSSKVTLTARTGTAQTRTVTAPGALHQVHQMGDWLFLAEGGNMQLVAVPLSGGTPRIVLPALARDPFVIGTNGTLYAVGGPDRYHWGIQSITLNAQGIPVAKELESLPSLPVRRYRPALTHGELTLGQTDHWDNTTQLYRTSVSGPAAITQTPTWSCGGYHDPICDRVRSYYYPSLPTGDGRIVGVTPESCNGCQGEVYVQDSRPGGSRRTLPLRTATAALKYPTAKAASGRYLLFSASGDPTRNDFVADLDTGKVLGDIPVAISGVSLWGALLWQPEGDTGVIAATDLRTGQVVRRIDLHTGCRPYELQVAGDWFYAACSQKAGYTYAAYHAPTGKLIPLPFQEERAAAKLGDGYVARRDRNGLAIYNLRSGSAVREYEDYEEANGWTVDRFGGRIARIDKDDKVRIIGVTGKNSPLSVIDQAIPPTVTPNSSTSGNTRWWLSKPAASWKLTVRNTANGISTVVRSGGETRGVIDVAWDGKDQNGRRLFGGGYEWTLTVQPADGHGPAVKSTGTLNLGMFSVFVPRTASGGSPALLP